MPGSSDFDPLLGKSIWQRSTEIQILEAQLRTANRVDLDKFQREVSRNIHILQSIADERLEDYSKLLEVVLSDVRTSSEMSDVDGTSLSNYDRQEVARQYEQKVVETEQLIEKNLAQEYIGLYSNLPSTASKERIDEERSRIAKSVAREAYDTEIIVKTPIFWRNIRDTCCPSLELISDDTFEIAKRMIPILVPLSLAGTVSLPLQPMLYAWIALVITRLGIKNICKEYFKEETISKESTLTMTEKESSRIINVNGNYIESNSGTYIQGNYVAMSQDLAQAANQIQELLTQLQNQGSTEDFAKQKVAEDLAKQSKNNPTVMGKLIKWGQSLGDTAGKTSVSEAAKIVITTALRLAGVPLP